MTIHLANGAILLLGNLVTFVVAVLFFSYVAVVIAKKKIDKAQHALICCGISFFLLTICSALKLTWWGIVIALTGTFIVGFGKEILDFYNPKKRLFDWTDIQADTVGAVTPVLIYIFSFLL